MKSSKKQLLIFFTFLLSTTTGFAVGKKNNEASKEKKKSFAKKSPEVKKTKMLYDGLRKKIFGKYGKDSVKKITVRNKIIEYGEVFLEKEHDVDLQAVFINDFSTVLVVEMKNGKKIAGVTHVEECRDIHKDGSISSEFRYSGHNDSYHEKIKKEGIEILKGKGLLEKDCYTEKKLLDDFIDRFEIDKTLVSETRQIL